MRVAGVIRRQEFAYDLCGDTGNTASRMESHGIPGRMQGTEIAYRLLQHRHRFQARGQVDVEGTGPMQAWLLVGRRESLPGHAPGGTR